MYYRAKIVRKPELRRIYLLTKTAEEIRINHPKLMHHHLYVPPREYENIFVHRRASLKNFFDKAPEIGDILCIELMGEDENDDGLLSNFEYSEVEDLLDKLEDTTHTIYLISYGIVTEVTDEIVKYRPTEIVGYLEEKLVGKVYADLENFYDEYTDNVDEAVADFFDETYGDVEMVIRINNKSRI